MARPFYMIWSVFVRYYLIYYFNIICIVGYKYEWIIDFIFIIATPNTVRQRSPKVADVTLEFIRRLCAYWMGTDYCCGTIAVRSVAI